MAQPLSNYFFGPEGSEKRNWPGWFSWKNPQTQQEIAVHFNENGNTVLSAEAYALLVSRAYGLEFEGRITTDD